MSCLGNALCLCRCITNLSLLSPTRTFNTSLSTSIARVGFSDASRLHCSHNQASIKIVRVLHIVLSPSMSVSWIPSTTLGTDTVDARSARSACVHTAIINISALMDGGEILVGFAVCFKRGLIFIIASQATRWLCALALGRHLLRSHDGVVNTGVLWVLTRTHPCDDPPRQGGEPSERQLVQCVVACAVAVA